MQICHKFGHTTNICYFRNEQQRASFHNGSNHIQSSYIGSNTEVQNSHNGWNPTPNTQFRGLAQGSNSQFTQRLIGFGTPNVAQFQGNQFNPNLMLEIQNGTYNTPF